MKLRFRLLVAYDGSAYHGWQIQQNARSVEGDLTKAAACLLNCGPEQVKIQGASRTDAGVHALGQVAHISYDIDKPLEPWDFVRALNALTDDDICVVFVEHAPPDFHARHSARGKIYRYEIWNHRFPHPMLRNRAWQVSAALDVDAMRRAAEKLVGEHDFASFRATDCSSETTVRVLNRVEIVEEGPRIRVEVEGTAFLKYMVRIIVGTLVHVGTGRQPPEVIDEMLAGCRRSLGGQTAPPQGLTLVEIFYPDFPWPGGTPELGGRWQVSQSWF
jgi:tRNA pseudouridine38-40 synthase